MNKKLLPFTLFASIFSMALYGASEQAAAAYKVDCAKGNMKACYYTGIDYEVKGDVLNAKEYYEKSCKGGEGYGCYFLGSLYTRGAGAPQDIRKGANFYKQACDMGNASGCVVYGGLHANPNSKINQNLTTAKTYYEKACSLEPYKCDRLGAMYAKGLGVERNLDKSKEYYAKACDGGNAPACLSILGGRVWHDMDASIMDCGGTLIANVADNKRVKPGDAIIDGATYGCSDYLGYQDHD